MDKKNVSIILGAAAAGLVAIGAVALIIRRKQNTRKNLIAASETKTLDELQLIGDVQTLRSDSEEKKIKDADLTLQQLIEREGLVPPKKTANKYCLHPDYLIQLLNFIGVLAN